MSGDLHSLLKARAALAPSPLSRAMGISVALHLALLVPLLVAGRGKVAAPEEIKVTWVTLPAAGGASGGSSPLEEGRTGERQRRVEDVAPEAGEKVQPMKVADAPGAEEAPTAKGTSKAADAKGAAPVAAKGKNPDKAPVTGAAGQGGGGGVGQGGGIPGLKASAGAQGGTGFIGELDGTFPYTWYLQQIQNAIYGNWSRLTSAQGRVQLYFRIRRDGRIEGLRTETSSGNATLDRSAEMAVRRSDPLPRLPEGYDGETLGVRYWFTN